MVRPRLLLVVAAALAAGAATSGAPLPQPPDDGAAGAWQRLLKLQTTASVLHVTAHPDDEHSGTLTWLSRHEGVRTALLTLNRGESGDNALGPELFDALGLIRTEELRLAGRYYGLDEQYYTSVADYGYSKRLDEALEQWDRDALLRDMVRVIRRSRPFVVVSRWRGDERDGHGQHQAAGALTPDAVRLAGDAGAFPELAQEGLRPWRVRKLYAGGTRMNEPWHVRLDAGAYDPVLGDSPQNLGRLGLSLQRSQTSGRYAPSAGPAPQFYTRRVPPASDGEREEGLFDGLDTSIGGLPAALGVTASADASARLADIAREAAAARDAFRWTDPAAAAPALARGLAATRAAIPAAGDADLAFALRVKEAQFADALTSALGISLDAIAQPAGQQEPTGPAAAFAPPPTMGPVTPGQAFDVRVIFATGTRPVTLAALALEGEGTWSAGGGADTPAEVTRDAPVTRRLAARVPADAAPTRPYFERGSIAESRYRLRDASLAGRPSTPPALSVRARYEVEGVGLDLATPVRRREAALPYGYERRDLEVLPPVGLAVSPSMLLVPADGSRAEIEVAVDVTGYVHDGVSGTVRLAVPSGWRVTPDARPFRFERGGEQARVAFTLRPPASPAPGRIEAVADAAGATWRSGYQVIRYRDLPTMYLVREASAMTRTMDVKIAPGLRVGYVMGIGDEVPAAITQLGASVTLLSASDLASGDLARLDTIVTGTRAYAVRDDLRTHTGRLLDWVKAGGNLVVLYNTQEYVPARDAPAPAELPRGAEEICEEDAAVEILAPDHPIFTTPNRIGPADFEGWIEQRGSKFFTTWDAAWTPLVSSHDRGQPPQRGGWLTMRHGKGHYTYMAYALHRQVPYGVPGAYRILANLLSLGR